MVASNVQEFGRAMKLLEFWFGRKKANELGEADLNRAKRWDDFFKNGPRVSEDFLTERQQPPAEERAPL
jgi:hypothetical protein